MNENAEAMRSIAESFEKKFEMYATLTHHLFENMYLDLQKFAKQVFYDEPNSYEFITETLKELANIFEIADARTAKMSKKRIDLFAKAAKMYEESGELETAGEMYLKSDEGLYYDKAMELFDKVEDNSKNKL